MTLAVHRRQYKGSVKQRATHDKAIVYVDLQVVCRQQRTGGQQIIQAMSRVPAGDKKENHEKGLDITTLGCIAKYQVGRQSDRDDPL